MRSLGSCLPIAFINGNGNLDIVSSYAMTNRVIATINYFYKAFLGKFFLVERDRLIVEITKDELLTAIN